MAPKANGRLDPFVFCFVLVAGQQLYTSRGTGNWGPPVRIFSPPEITLIEIVPE